jgi:hypothetical protein
MEQHRSASTHSLHYHSCASSCQEAADAAAGGAGGLGGGGQGMREGSGYGGA